MTLTDNQLDILHQIADETNTVYPIFGGDDDPRTLVEVRRVPGDESLDLEDVEFLLGADLIDLVPDNDEDKQWYTYCISEDGDDEPGDRLEWPGHQPGDQVASPAVGRRPVGAEVVRVAVERECVPGLSTLRPVPADVRLPAHSSLRGGVLEIQDGTHSSAPRLCPSGHAKTAPVL